MRKLFNFSFGGNETMCKTMCVCMCVLFFIFYFIFNLKQCVKKNQPKKLCIKQ